jgi:hypothetical protein
MPREHRSGAHGEGTPRFIFAPYRADPAKSFRRFDVGPRLAPDS